MTPSRVKAALHARKGEFAERVAPAYAALGWEWKSAEGIPGRGQIVRALGKLIDMREWGAEGGSISSGGLTVWIEVVDGVLTGGFEFGLGLALD